MTGTNGKRPWLHARVLVVDDELANVALLQKILQYDGYSNVRSTRDSREVMDLVRDFAPDIILLDLQMPYMDGHEILTQLRTHLPADTFLPVLVLTADITPQAKERALANGAQDYLTKPFEPMEVLLRIRNLLQSRLMHLELREHNASLEEKVVERTRDLEKASYEIVSRLARAAEFRDDQTGQHTARVGEIASMVGRKLRLPVAQLDLLKLAAPLHDIGKIGISDLILLKPGKLSADEFNLMKTHVIIGSRILSGSRYPVLNMAEEIARFHHERWDGTGYLNGLAGDEIPITARIVAVVDVFDALTHERPYKEAWPVGKALEEISSLSGRHFDPQVVNAFLHVVSEMTNPMEEVM